MKFVAIEGLDASGKTTQASLLADRLAESGLRVVTWSFPRYDTFFGRRIKTLLEGNAQTSAANLDPSSMALWFAVDRWDAVNTMTSEIGNVDVVLLNRWTLSNAVYQGARAQGDAAQNDLFDWVLDLEYHRFGLPRPTINVVLEVSVETSMSRARDRASLANLEPDVYESSARLLYDSRRLYRRAASLFPEVQIVDADQRSRDDVRATIFSVVQGAL